MDNYYEIPEYPTVYDGPYRAWLHLGGVFRITWEGREGDPYVTSRLDQKEGWVNLGEYATLDEAKESLA